MSPPPVRAQEREPDLVQMVFAPEPPAQDPLTFTELPEDRATESPERADLLSNVDSRASDEVPGGDAQSMPQLTGSSDFPQVQLDKGTQGSPPTPDTPPSRHPEDARPETESESTTESESPAADDSPAIARHTDSGQRAEDGASSEERSRLIQTPSGLLQDRQPPRREAPSVPPSPSSPQDSEPGTPGLSDIDQEEMSSLETNADFFRGISLNTKQWDFAPWLMDFRRQFVEKWVAPLGYQLGWIYGRNTLELEIAPSGELLRCDVIAETGHPALSSASAFTAKAAAPYEPLPSDFPEPTLILRLTLDYPELRPRR
ncbi:MAG: hypothetical protein KC729_16535 [Candidatus Eisenbacteria bacterium]|uniref:TonB C-terminal domain-containing protein n=1 Tax=Eiseniibacteriota bacterium TaxID=2212470 RepID=A0A956RR75_UNCEI|nr:hypothetical protein [Candidatus Eisenbacteria bacterium]